MKKVYMKGKLRIFRRDEMITVIQKNTPLLFLSTSTEFLLLFSFLASISPFRAADLGFSFSFSKPLSSIVSV